MKLFPRAANCRFVRMLAVLAIALAAPVVQAEAQTSPPAVAPAPRLTLTAEQEYIIREIILKDMNVPKEKSAPEGVGDSVPDNIKLTPLPGEISQKVPQAKSHMFFVMDDDTIVLVSPSDRRVADILKKKSSD
jgi:hypothetical protein